MIMGTYQYVCEFKLGQTNYVMFMDQENKRFFLKHMNNSYSYVTSEELFNICSSFHHSEDVYDSEKEKPRSYKFIPKIVIGTQAAILIPSILLTSLLYYNQKRRYNRLREQSNVSFYYRDSHPEQINAAFIEKYLSAAEKYNLDGNKIDTYLQSDMLHYSYIYDMDYIGLVYDEMDISLEELNNVVDSNSNIPDSFKILIKEYCSQLCKNYTNIELRPFYENLKTLKVIECNQNELLLHTLSPTSSGCYVRSENVIYVPEKYTYQKGTWDYQVIFHELTHCARTQSKNIDGVDVKIQFQGLNYSNTVSEEALNSLLAVSILGYEEKDVAYQLQSNYHMVMLECLNNYDLSDYMNHSLTYFVSKLDEHNNEQGQAVIVLELIEMQYDDFHRQDIEISQEQFYRVYDYISKMYYDKYLYDGMPYDEMKAVCDELIGKITYDVPSEYNIDINHFYNYFDYYVDEHNYVSARER